MKIYLAGKVSKNCWRHKVVHNLKQRSPEGGHDWPVLEKSILNKHDYVGPFFTSCDHGCFHGDSSHGVGMNQDTLCFGERPIKQQDVLRACTNALNKCDVLVAWLNSRDAFGTISEIAYAYRCGKKIYIMSDQYYKDMWFSYAMASRHLIRSEFSEEALKGLLD